MVIRACKGCGSKTLKRMWSPGLRDGEGMSASHEDRDAQIESQRVNSFY